MRYRLEYALAWIFLKSIGALPRPLARAVGISLAWTVYFLHGTLRRVGRRNLEMAFPDKTRKDRAKILRGVFTSLGRQLAEVCLYRRYTRLNVSKTVVYEGFENYERALARGKGVLFLTAHLGAWELSAFAHSLYGYPLGVLSPPWDNPYLDRFVRAYRGLHGNKTMDKGFGRGLIAAMRKGETVGVLMDTNMIASQGVFVDFFGIQGLHRQRHRPRGSADRRRSRPRLYRLGPDAEKISPQVRSRGHADSHQGHRSRRDRQHGVVCENYRGLCAAVSGPVAVGASEMEDEAGRGGGAVLKCYRRRIRENER